MQCVSGVARNSTFALTLMTSRFPNWNSILGCQPVRQLGRNECKNWGNRCQVEGKLIGLHSNSEFFLTKLSYKMPSNSTSKNISYNLNVKLPLQVLLTESFISLIVIEYIRFVKNLQCKQKIRKKIGFPKKFWNFF